MTVFFLIILIYCSILASVVALYVLIIGSFEKKENDEKFASPFVKRDSRIIKVNRLDEKPALQTAEGADTQISSLIWTTLVGQAVGLYFLLVFLNDYRIVNTILKLNGIILLIASFLCSILTIANAWFKKKMETSYRLIFQGYSLIMALILFLLGIGKGVTMKKAIIAAGFFPNVIIIMYFSSVIIALALMLFDGLYRKHERVDYDFNKYFRLVVLIGMVIGLSLLFAMSILRRS